jgi:hypothetical protein
MEKSIIIIGPAESGKTKKAREIASSYCPENVVMIDGRKKLIDDPFLFSHCDSAIELFFVDDILRPKTLEYLYGVLRSDEITINKRGKKPFTIKPPRAILTCDESITRNDLNKRCPGFERFFNVIDLFEKKTKDIPEIGLLTQFKSFESIHLAGNKVLSKLLKAEKSAEQRLLYELLKQVVGTDPDALADVGLSHFKKVYKDNFPDTYTIYFYDIELGQVKKYYFPEHHYQFEFIPKD